MKGGIREAEIHWGGGVHADENEAKTVVKMVTNAMKTVFLQIRVSHAGLEIRFCHRKNTDQNRTKTKGLPLSLAE